MNSAPRTYVMWALQLPNGQPAAGDGFYDIPWPLNEKRLEELRQSVADEVGQKLAKRALKAGLGVIKINPLSVQFVMMAPAGPVLDLIT